MIGAALRKILLRRTGVEGGVAPSGRRKGNRAVILCVLLAGLLVMRPEPAQACCDADCPGAYLCDPFTVPCAAIAAFEAFATIVANLAIYIETVVNPPIVDAAHGLGSKAATALQATMLSNKEVAHAASKQKTFWDMYLADKKLTIDNFPNTGDELCRLATVRKVAEIGEWYQRGTAQEMSRASTALAVNPIYNTQRMQMSATQRYCKNGMLTRASMGNTAFDKMECFEDPIYADAYIQAGRILDHLVLVPPNSAPPARYRSQPKFAVRYGGKVSPERLTMPAASIAATPVIAIAIANSHARMRPLSPMLTQSDTAPMVQKCVLFPTAPKTKARRNAPG